MNEAPSLIPAATILMLRQGNTGLEVFMVVRHHQIDFASGALVFPGGKIDAGDSDVASYCFGGASEPAALAMQVGAIREAFEECGILLARPKGETALVDAARLAQLDHYRKTLNKGEISLKDFLEQESLILACDRLTHFAHWVTPDMMPKRFDTHFYLAEAPSDHLAEHDGYESVDSVWISPEDALAGGESGKYTIIFPTRLNIEMLSESDSVESAIEMAESRDIKQVLPWIEKREAGAYLCINPEAGYKVSEELLPAPKKNQ